MCYLHVADEINFMKLEVYMKVGLTGRADWMRECNQRHCGKIEKCGEKSSSYQVVVMDQLTHMATVLLKKQ